MVYVINPPSCFIYKTKQIKIASSTPYRERFVTNFPVRSKSFALFVLPSYGTPCRVNNNVTRYGQLFCICPRNIFGYNDLTLSSKLGPLGHPIYYVDLIISTF